jgi:hypothetical protein
MENTKKKKKKQKKQKKEQDEKTKTRGNPRLGRLESSLAYHILLNAPDFPFFFFRKKVLFFFAPRQTVFSCI